MGTCGSSSSLAGVLHSLAWSRGLPRDQAQAVERYLPDFRIFEASTEAHRQLAADHWNTWFREGASPSLRSTTGSETVISSSGRQDSRTANGLSRVAVLYDAFFAHIEQHSPELIPVFRSSMHVRTRVLMHISAGMRQILSSEHIADKLSTVTKTHLRAGVRLEQYNAMGNALLHGLKVASEDHWTLETEDAWRRLFAHCSAVLLAHHQRAVEQVPPIKMIDDPSNPSWVLVSDIKLVTQ